MARAVKNASRSKFGSMGSWLTASAISFCAPPSRGSSSPRPLPEEGDWAAFHGVYSRPPDFEAGAGFCFLANSSLAFVINCCLCSYSRFSAAALLVALIVLWWEKP